MSETVTIWLIIVGAIIAIIALATIRDVLVRRYEYLSISAADELIRYAESHGYVIDFEDDGEEDECCEK